MFHHSLAIFEFQKPVIVSEIDASEIGIVPLSGGSIDNRVWAAGEDRESGLDPNFNWVGEGYFKTLGTPFLAGRDFGEQDTPGSPKVAIVNEEFARRLGKGANPVGVRIRREATPHEPETEFEIVGMVKNSKYRELREKFRPIVYLCVTQNPNPDPVEQVVIQSSPPLPVLTSRMLGPPCPRLASTSRTPAVISLQQTTNQKRASISVL